MTPITKQYAEVNMDTVDTLDIKGLPQEKVNYLQQLIERWKEQAKARTENQPGDEDDVKPSDFIVKHSNVKGGRVTRAMAYE